jgi:hypothetical protein
VSCVRKIPPNPSLRNAGGNEAVIATLSSTIRS